MAYDALLDITIFTSSNPMLHRDKDPETQQVDKSVSYFKLLYDHAGASQPVLHHKYHGDGTIESPFLVEFLPDDPWNPTTFSQTRKWAIALLQTVGTLSVSFASSAYSGTITEVIKTFSVSQTVSILGVSLFVLGFALGPLLWAPLSEVYGRQRVFIGTFFGITAFLAASCAAQNIETLLILRLLAGAFGSSPLTNSGAVVADMFSAAERGLAASIFTAAVFLGPMIGPIAGGFLSQAAGWRWVEGMMAIFTGAILLVSLFICPETYAPYLLRQRADALSKATGKRYKSKLEDSKVSVSTILLRPWILLFKEPIVLLTAIYIAIVYGTLYMLFAAFPIVYQQSRGWSPGIGGLAFIGVAVGVLIGSGYFLYDNKRYVTAIASAEGDSQPEARLPPAIVGSLFLPVGLFWFAWTNGPNVHWLASIAASSFFGMGLVLVFLGLFNYVIDTYVIYAASALAANNVIRSLFGAAFPLFTTKMYNNLGIHWASSIPAFLALACVPFPFLFWKYGKAIRSRCKYASEAAAVLARMKAQKSAPGVVEVAPVV